MDTSEQTYNVALASQIDDGSQPEPQDVEEGVPVSNDVLVDIEIRDMILTRKEASRTWRHEKKLLMDRCWNHYKQVYDTTNKEPWQSTTFIPASPKVAEVITSNMHSALMGPDHPVEYQPRRPEFETQVRDVNDLINVDFENSKFKVHWTDFLRTLCIVGTSVGKIEYIKEEATVTIKERTRPNPAMEAMRSLIGLPPAPTETTRTERMLVKDYASFRNCDLYDIYPEPGTIDFSKDRWVIEEGKICNYKLLELKDHPDDQMRIVNVTDELLMTNPRELTSDGEKQERDTANNEPVKTTAYLEPDQEHRLDEYWGPAPIWMIQPELYGKEEHKYTMVNAWFWLIDGQHVVRKQNTPWRDAEPPYVKGVYIRVPGQFYGIGPLEMILNLQVELNESRNCRQDEINLKLSMPMGIVKDMVSKEDWSRFVLGPGALWPFTNCDDIRKALYPIPLDANLGESWRSSAEIYAEIQEVTAAVKAVVGNDGGSGANEAGTFRGQMLNKQSASERFIMYARILEITGLGDAWRKFYQRIYQFKGFEAAEQILGPERAAQFEFTAPEVLDSMAKLVPMGVTSMENKGVQLAQMAEEFKMFGAFPWYKQVEAARKMVVQRGQADPDGVIMSDDELKMFNEQRRQMMGMGMPGGEPQMEGPQGPPPGPVAGNVPLPSDGTAQPPMPAQGPGTSPMDLTGRPLS
jgi:hypothetical protein